MEDVNVNVDIEQFILSKDDSFVCCLCHDYTPSAHCFVKRHILQLHYHHSEIYNGQHIMLCKLLCRKESHYHCICGCDKIYVKISRLKSHLEKKVKK